jgi:protocatechuate 3,4-dioxygenase beta subunit
MRRFHPKQLFRIQRRRLLLALGSSMLAVPSQAQSSRKEGAAGTAPACRFTPEQTEGPFFLDTRLERSDIRSNHADGSVKAGVPLMLTLRVQAIRDGRCMPLAGAVVDVWHCDAAGVYSGVGNAGSDEAKTTFLRGYQTTDRKGQVRFLTIYPGWYPGRAVHIHFKVRSKNKGGHHAFTSQLYFDDAVTARVHARAPYAAHRGTPTPNERDGLFRRGGRELMLHPEVAGRGYAASFDIGVDLP